MASTRERRTSKKSAEKGVMEMAFFRHSVLPSEKALEE